MTITINDSVFTDVFSFSYCYCELTMVFNKNHCYSSIADIAKELNRVGIPIGNFYFKGVSMWEYYTFDDEVNPNLQSLLDDDGETSLLCMIPENVRKDLRIYCS